MSSLKDVITDSLTGFLRELFEPVGEFISENLSEILQLVVGTPHPNSVFSQPTNGAWSGIYEYYWETIIPLSLLLWSLSIGIIILLESTSHLFSSYHRSKLKKRAFSGLIGILSWWWIASLSLRFMDGLGKFIIPSLTDVSMFETASFAGIGILSVAVASLVDFTLLLLMGILYYGRHIMLYLFTLLMPLLIVFWVPGVGPFSMASRLMKRLAGFYVPFLFMTVPVAVLFRLGELLGTSADLSIGGFGQWLMAIIIPLLAVAAPIILFWQAGSIFNVARTTAHHASRQRARSRISQVKSTSRQPATVGRNFVRGVRGQSAVRSDGQTLLGSGDSRSHTAGSRLRTTASTFSSQQENTTGSTKTTSGGGATASRNASFDTLRDRGETNRSSDAYSEEERPYYVN